MVIIFVIIFLLSVFIYPLFISNDFIGNFGDLHLHYYPLKHLITERLIAGDMPLWNPYIFSGMPLLANPQSGIFYPLAAVFYFFPIQFAFKLWLFIHLFILFFSTFLLFNHLLRNQFSALASSVALVFSSYIIYLIPAGHIIMLAGWSWMPAVILAYIKICETPHSPLKRGVTRNGGVCFLKILLLSVLLALQFLSGHPQGTFVTLVMAVMFIAKGKFSVWKELIYSLALFVLIVSIQLLPSIEFSRLIETLFWEPLAKSYSLELKNLITIILPNFYGTPLTALPSAMPVSHFFEKNKLYFGISSLSFSLYGFFLFFKSIGSLKRSFSLRDTENTEKYKKKDEDKNSMNSVFICVHLWLRNFLKNIGSIFFIFILLGFLFSFGFNTPLYKFLYDYVPLWSFFRTPSRFYVMALIGFCYFAGLALNKLPRKLQIAAVAIIFLELLLWNQRFIFTKKITIGKSEFSQVYDSNARIFTTPEIPANLSMFYHHYNINGYDALILRNYFRTFYAYFEPPDVSPPSTFLDLKNYNSLVKNDFPGWAMRYVITTENLENTPLLKKTGPVNIYEKKKYSPKIVFVEKVNKNYPELVSGSILSSADEIPKQVRNDKMDTFLTDTNLDIIDYSQKPEKIKIVADVKSDGFLVLGDVYYPGWQAWSDGKKIQILGGDGVYRTLFLNKNAQTIRLIFNSMPYVFGVFTTTLTLVFIVGRIMHQVIGHIQAHY